MPSTSTKPVTSSTQSPLCLRQYIPKPSYHPTNKNCIIISTDYTENNVNKRYEMIKATLTTPGIYKYNMETNESEIIYKYNNTFQPCCHGQFIDTSNNTLILYGDRYK
eukprot:96868_1